MKEKMLQGEIVQIENRRLTEKEFRIQFSEACRLLRIDPGHVDVVFDGGIRDEAAADISYDHAKNGVIIRLNREHIDGEDIREVAFHEAAHLVNLEYYETVKKVFSGVGDIFWEIMNESNEKVARTIANSLMEMSKELPLITKGINDD